MLQRFAVYRVLRIAGVALPAIAAYRWLELRERLGRPASPAAWDRVHDRTARGLHDLGIHLAGLFVKLCQVVGARADNFPEPYIRRLGRFHDAVPPRPFPEMRVQIERELGRPLEDVFSTMDEHAIAAASLAQVHRATLRDGGADVAVKVQYPEIARLAQVDLACLRLLARVTGGLSRAFDMRSVIDEIAEFVGLELDFAREADATERVAAALASDPTVRVPRVHRAHSTAKLLVLEYLDGIKVVDVDALRAAGHDPAEVARRIGRLYARMIFEQGFFQGDPHPGNLLVLPGTVIGLLDFGLSKELPPGFGPAVAELVTRGLGGDVPGAVAAARRAGFELRDDQATALPALVLVMLGDRDEQANTMRLIQETPITRVPSHFGLIARVLLLLNGLSHRLAPGQMIVQRALVETLAAQSAGAADATTADGLPPGPAAPPLLQVMRWVQWPLPFLDECAQRFGETFTLRFPSAPPIVMFAHPDAIKTIFTGDEEDLRAGEANYRLEPILGKHSLLILDGHEHLRERRLLQPPFHGDRMLAYGGVMRDIAAAAVDRWPAGRPFAVHPEMQGVTLDVILRTVFGLDEGPTKRDLRARAARSPEPGREPAAPAGRAAVEWQRGATRRALLLGPRARGPPALRRDHRPPAGRRRRSPGHPLAAGAGDVRGRPPAGRPGATRRADDHPARRSRDHGDRAGLGRQPRAGAPRGARAHRATSCGELGAGPLDPQRVTRLEYLDAVCRETLRLTPIVPLVGGA